LLPVSHLEDHLVVDEILNVLLSDERPPMADNDVGPAEAAAVRADLHSARAQMRIDGDKAVEKSIATQQPRKVAIIELRTSKSNVHAHAHLRAKNALQTRLSALKII
jgi:hypothetical protein